MPVARSLAQYKFMVSIDLFETVTIRFADIVLPDCSYPQSVDSPSNYRSFSAIRRREYPLDGANGLRGRTQSADTNHMESAPHALRRRSAMLQ